MNNLAVILAGRRRYVEAVTLLREALGTYGEPPQGRWTVPVSLNLAEATRRARAAGPGGL
jgi:hypothetical protein